MRYPVSVCVMSDRNARLDIKDKFARASLEFRNQQRQSAGAARGIEITGRDPARCLQCLAAAGVLTMGLALKYVPVAVTRVPGVRVSVLRFSMEGGMTVTVLICWFTF